MTRSAALVRQKALSLVGQGYIYGAKGQTCTPAFRQQQAQQYPEQARNILETGVKWDGMPVWDCAQLTRAAAKAAGLCLVSGATSQWNRTDWIRKGTIDTLPQSEVAFLFRQADGKMQHTGISLGDGAFVHARGTAYGVVQQRLQDYAWTHWASPWPSEAPAEALPPAVIGTARVWAQSGGTVNVRSEPGGKVIARLVIGTQVDICAQSAGWTAILHDGKIAYMQSAFLKETSVEEQLEALCERMNQMEARLSSAGL